ncbi:hypothetical protein C8R45DRAFT_941561 [Mycena sanguinolenta]|nr:hypothetical protein C8R45DRAFT_941561 [Mycena sanguinolenta]
MKFFSRFALSTLFAAAALAQTILITSPAPGSNVARGSNITVELSMLESLTSSVEGSLALGLWPCGPGGETCLPASEVLGTVLLYNGPFNPNFLNNQSLVSQNITVNIPSGAPTGNAQLQGANFILVGEELSPALITFGVNVTVV